MTVKEKTPAEPQDKPAETPAAPTSPNDSDSKSPTEAGSSRILAESVQSQHLMTDNLQLVLSRVQQMADSQKEMYEAHKEALEVLKTSAQLMQEYMANLQAEVDRLVTVSAALLRYSQEQAQLAASGGSQA